MNYDYLFPIILSLVRSFAKVFGAYEYATSETQAAKVAGAIIALLGFLASTWKAHKTVKEETGANGPIGIPPTPPPPPHSMLWILLLPLVCFTPACSSILPGSDPVVVHAEQVEKIAMTTFDTYVRLEFKNRDQLKKVSLDFEKAADKIRVGATNWVASLDRTILAFKHSKTPENKADLVTALATLNTALAEAEGYISRAAK
jgi:hypothetical protein